MLGVCVCTWAQVPPEFQGIVNRLGERCAASGGAGTPGMPAGTPPRPPGSAPLHPQQADGAQVQPLTCSGPPRVLVLNGKRFHLVNATLMLLKTLDEYLLLHDTLPHFGAETVHRLLELLKFFNTHTCQLVLGAGAMSTAGAWQLLGVCTSCCACVAGAALLRLLLFSVYWCRCLGC